MSYDEPGFLGIALGVLLILSINIFLESIVFPFENSLLFKLITLELLLYFYSS
jgi:hypothetical protein